MLDILLFSEPDYGFSYILVKLNPEMETAILQEKFFFSASDAVEFGAISHPYKQLEWLASRYAIHSLLAHNQLVYKGLWKDEAGKPYLADYPDHFSLTHTQGYAAAAMHPSKPIGIDIEWVSPKLSKVAHKFLSPSEFNHADSLEKLCVYWAAKEALYKLHGKKGEISFMENLYIQPFDIQEDSFMLKGFITREGNTKSYKILIQKIEDLFLAVAV